MSKTVSIRDINKEIAADMKKEIKWEPAVIENEETGELFWGSTDNPIKEIWNSVEAQNYLCEFVLDADEDKLVELMKLTGLNVVRTHDEYIILEDKAKEKLIIERTSPGPGGMITSIGYRGSD